MLKALFLPIALAVLADRSRDSAWLIVRRCCWGWMPFVRSTRSRSISPTKACVSPARIQTDRIILRSAQRNHAKLGATPERCAFDRTGRPCDGEPCWVRTSDLLIKRPKG